MTALQEHLPWVRRLARWVVYRRSAPPHMVDDLVQAGLIGLHDCIGRYDGSGGTSLQQFAAKRVIGAMIDEVRRCSPLSRAHWESGAEIRFVEINESTDGADDRPTPEHQIERSQIRALMLRLVDGLPARERQVIVGIYFGERELLDVGAELGVSDSYVSEIKGRALATLRMRMAAALAGTDKRQHAGS